MSGIFNPRSVANPTASVGLSAVNGSASSAMRSDGAPALDQSISPTMTGNWSFTPSSLASSAITLTQNGAVPAVNIFPGLHLLQTFSVGDAAVGNTLNQISITDSSAGTTTNGISINYGLNSGWHGQKVAFNSDIFVGQDPGSNPGGTGIPVGIVATARGVANVNPSYVMGLFATNFGVNVSGTGYGQMIGLEVDMGITSTGTALSRCGIQVIGTGTVSGTAGTDIGYFIAAGVGDPGWDLGISWTAGAFKTSSSIIGGANAVNAKYGVDFSSVTFTSGGFAFRSSGFSVDPSGNIVGIIDTASATFKLNGAAFGTKAQANAALSAGLLAFKVSVDFNTANTDYQIPITLPTGYTRYIVNSVRVSGASASLTTATAGLFTASGGGGVAIVAGGSAITVSTASEETLNNAQGMTTPNAATSHTATTLYWRVGTAEGSAATATVTVYIFPAS